jgi:CO/xanthine dehydrogenase Mo-binding subunit
VIGAGDRGAELFCGVPNVSIRSAAGLRGGGRSLHLFGVGSWRAPGANMNVFAKESQVDLMAAAADSDPIEPVLVRNDALDPQGGGEPAIVPMGAVLANAVFDATGVRFYRLPMTPARVRAALAQAKEAAAKPA